MDFGLVKRAYTRNTARTAFSGTWKMVSTKRN